MERHERRCWNNPNRFCDACQNTGKVYEAYDSGGGYAPCYYCAKFKPQEYAPVDLSL